MRGRQALLDRHRFPPRTQIIDVHAHHVPDFFYEGFDANASSFAAGALLPEAFQASAKTSMKRGRPARGVNQAVVRDVVPRTNLFACMPQPLFRLAPGVPLHVIQRGERRAACFFGEGDRFAYLHWLRAYARRSGCAVHAYVLMGNHVHLLLTPERANGLESLMETLGERYARYVGESRGRAGALWEERFEASPVHVRRHFFACMRYIELNPVRARLVEAPDEYPWSSYRANALGREDAIVTPHPHYYALGRRAASRQAAYRALFCESDDEGGRDPLLVTQPTLPELSPRRRG